MSSNTVQKILNIKVEKISLITGNSFGRITVTRPLYGDKCSFTYESSNFAYSLKSTICQYGFSQANLESVKDQIDQIILETPQILENSSLKIRTYELVI